MGWQMPTDDGGEIKGQRKDILDNFDAYLQ